MKHKHCDVIKAWADGAIVQVLMSTGEWRSVVSPEWNTTSQYRASLAIVEGRPVFEGDELYFSKCNPIEKGIAVSASEEGIYFKDANKVWLPFCALSWLPPKPKTVTVTIPVPKHVFIVDYHTKDGGIEPRLEIAYVTIGDRDAAEAAMKDALK